MDQSLTNQFLTGLCRPFRFRQLRLPLFSGKVAAGFPSPADDYVEKTLDLNELLVKKPAATFFARAQGESMLGAGIHPNDILVVDRSIEPVPGKIVIVEYGVLNNCRTW
jgi:DNA polymerase V